MSHPVSTHSPDNQLNEMEVVAHIIKAGSHNAVKNFIRVLPKLFKLRFNVELITWYDSFLSMPVSQRCDRKPLTREQWDYIAIIEDNVFLYAKQEQK
jgi:hypothetical protein